MPNQKLEGWKEIAAYFRKQVRTVQRWEKDEGLPVQRHDHTERSTVFAFSDDLEEWKLARSAQTPRTGGRSHRFIFAVGAAAGASLCLLLWALAAGVREDSRERAQSLFSTVGVQWPVGAAEGRALRAIAASPGSVRIAVTELVLENEGNATRFLRRAYELSHAVVGLDLDLRARLIEEVLEPRCIDGLPDSDPALHACLYLVEKLDPGSLDTVTFLVNAFAAAESDEVRRHIARALAVVADRIDAEQRAKVADLALEWIGDVQYHNHATDLARLVAATEPGHAPQAFDLLLARLRATKTSVNAAILVEALAALCEYVDHAQQERALALLLESVDSPTESGPALVIFRFVTRWPTPLSADQRGRVSDHLGRLLSAPESSFGQALAIDAARNLPRSTRLGLVAWLVQGLPRHDPSKYEELSWRFSALAGFPEELASTSSDVDQRLPILVDQATSTDQLNRAARLLGQADHLSEQRRRGWASTAGQAIRRASGNARRQAALAPAVNGAAAVWEPNERLEIAKILVQGISSVQNIEESRALAQALQTLSRLLRPEERQEVATLLSDEAATVRHPEAIAAHAAAMADLSDSPEETLAAADQVAISLLASRSPIANESLSEAMVTICRTADEGAASGLAALLNSLIQGVEDPNALGRLIESAGALGDNLNDEQLVHLAQTVLGRMEREQNQNSMRALANGLGDATESFSRIARPDFTKRLAVVLERFPVPPCGLLSDFAPEGSWPTLLEVVQWPNCTLAERERIMRQVASDGKAPFVGSQESLIQTRICLHGNNELDWWQFAAGVEKYANQRRTLAPFGLAAIEGR